MEDFAWNMNVNFTKAKNKVVALPEGTQTIQLGRFQGGITIQATKGDPYGVLYGTVYLYDDNGNKLVYLDTGFYMLTSTSNNVIYDLNPYCLFVIFNSFT